MKPLLSVLFALAVISAGLIAFSNSFSGELLLDDSRQILRNERIHELWPMWKTLSGRRPVVDFALAVNYALGGAGVWGYHAFNLAVHILAALTLFGVVRRTLLTEPLQNRFGPASRPLALIVALIWVVHPLQTQSVTYVIQRAESMMGLFYLLTLYCVIRGIGSPHRGWWYAGATASCALGMGSKAVMVTAPVAVLLWDRAFASGSFRAALTTRHVLYAALCATWSVLGLCGVAWGVLNPVPRNVTVGFGVSGISPLQYAMTQPGVIVQYLMLSVWPRYLCLDYAWPIAADVFEVVLPTVVITSLVVATFWLCRRHPSAGFLGAWFFLILSPTSSFIPIRDPLFEHRMYLPLAAVIVAVVVAVRRAVQCLPDAGSRRVRQRSCLSVTLAVVVVAALACRTYHRNEDYRTGLDMWRDVVSKRPDSARGHYNLACALYEQGRAEEAVEEYREALRIRPDYVEAHNNLGLTLFEQGKLDEAITHYRRALDLEPRSAENIHYNLGNALGAQGKLDEAINEYERALKSMPEFADARFNLGVTFAKRGRLDQAIREFGAVLQVRSDDPKAHMNLGSALAQQGQTEDAIRAFRAAIQMDPQHVDAHYNLGHALLEWGDVQEAIKEYRETLRLRPDHSGARQALEAALARSERP